MLTLKDVALRNMKITPYLLKRFWSKVLIPDDDDCWTWVASIRSDGYGQFGITHEGKDLPILAHRMALSLSQDVGGQMVLHSCDVPACVNPSHLRLGDERENHRDMVTRDRHLYGSRNGNTFLSEWQVLEIKQRIQQGEQYKIIAMDYGVSDTAVRHIAHGRSWRHVSL